jgi:hypothetical protein
MPMKHDPARRVQQQMVQQRGQSTQAGSCDGARCLDPRAQHRLAACGRMQLRIVVGWSLVRSMFAA